jgi:predicted dehydrogenase
MTVGWGIAGPGAIAVGFANDLALVDDARLVAVGSRSAERGASFAARFGAASHGSYEDLAANPDVDAVYVATPASRHAADVVMFLEAGKHVLCEKPFALDETQATHMIATATRTARFLMEAMWTRFLPPYRLLASLLDDGVIGAPSFVESDFGFGVPREPMHRLWDPSLGGGSLLDLGVYPVQLASLVLGAPERVAAAGHVGPSGVDEIVVAVTTHLGGSFAVSKSSITVGMACTARIAGERGVIELPAFMHCPPSVTVVGFDGRRTHETPWPGGGLQFQVAEVHRCLAEGRLESSVMPHAESLSIMRTLDSIRHEIGLGFPAEDDQPVSQLASTGAASRHPDPGGPSS